MWGFIMWILQKWVYALDFGGLAVGSVFCDFGGAATL